MIVLLWLIVVMLVLLAIWTFNRLVHARNTVSQAWADIDVQLQKRHELVPNLVATVKGYMQHEAETLEQVSRNRQPTSNNQPELQKQENDLSRSLGRLFAVAEDYPELHADQGFRQLHQSLVRIEDDLQYARRYYNGAVRDNNNLVEGFPSNLVARSFRFKPADFFEIELASQRQVPDVEI